MEKQYLDGTLIARFHSEADSVTIQRRLTELGLKFETCDKPDLKGLYVIRTAEGAEKETITAIRAKFSHRMLRFVELAAARTPQT